MKKLNINNIAIDVSKKTETKFVKKVVDSKLYPNYDIIENNEIRLTPTAPSIEVRRLSAYSKEQSSSSSEEDAYYNHKNYVPKRNSPGNISNSTIKSGDDSLSVIQKIKLRKKIQDHGEYWD